MKKSILYLLLISICFGLTGCDNYWNNYKRTRAKVDKLIAERKFEKARETVNNNITNNSKVKPELLNLISYTQLNMLMEDGDYETAAALAHELQMEDLFYESFFTHIRQIIKSNRYDFVFETLMDWTAPFEPKSVIQGFLYEFDWLLEEREPRVDHNGEFYKSQDPGQYNWCVRKVNSTVDIVLQKVMFEGNSTNIRRCLMCYKPYSVFDRKEKTTSYSDAVKEYYYRFYFKSKNTAKADAEKMLREAKIQY